MDRTADDIGDALGKLEVHNSRAHMELLSSGLHAILHQLVGQKLQAAQGAEVVVAYGILGVKGHSDPYPAQVLITKKLPDVFHGVCVVIRHSFASTRAGPLLYHLTRDDVCALVIRQRAVQKVIQVVAPPFAGWNTGCGVTNLSKFRQSVTMSTLTVFIISVERRIRSTARPDMTPAIT